MRFISGETFHKEKSPGIDDVKLKVSFKTVRAIVVANRMPE